MTQAGYVGEDVESVIQVIQIDFSQFANKAVQFFISLFRNLSKRQVEMLKRLNKA